MESRCLCMLGSMTSYAIGWVSLFGSTEVGTWNKHLKECRVLFSLYILLIPFSLGREFKVGSSHGMVRTETVWGIPNCSICSWWCSSRIAKEPWASQFPQGLSLSLSLSLSLFLSLSVRLCVLICQTWFHVTTHRSMMLVIWFQRISLTFHYRCWEGGWKGN